MRESWEVRGRRGEKGKAELQKVGGEERRKKVVSDQEWPLTPLFLILADRWGRGCIRD